MEIVVKYNDLMKSWKNLFPILKVGMLHFGCWVLGGMGHGSCVKNRRIGIGWNGNEMGNGLGEINN